MRRVPIYRWSNSKFLNPFMVGEFYYDHSKFYCLDQKLQTYLFLWMYGLNKNKNICKLFSIVTPQGGLIELPWRRLSKLMYRVYQTQGWVIQDLYTQAIQNMYLQACKDDMILPYNEDKYIFNIGTRTTWDSWIDSYILVNYPDLIKTLNSEYKEINLFFY